MILRFLGFLSRARQASEELSIEPRPDANDSARSEALAWAKASGPTPEPCETAQAAKKSPRRERLRTRLLFHCALAAALATFAPYLLYPSIDQALRPEQYLPAAKAIEKARAAGFEGAQATLGSWDVYKVWDDYQHARDPQKNFGKGMGAEASFPRMNIGPVSLLPDRCYVRIGSNAAFPLLPNPQADLQFTALHEISHCDTRMGSPVGFSPSAQELSAEEARALRLVILAGTQSILQGSIGASRIALSLSKEAREAPQDEQERWGRLAATLFSESLADARALLILSRLEPQTWRQTGWSLWLERAVGEIGASSATAHDHATEEAIALMLSVPDARLERLSPKGLTELAGFVASDALPQQLARQSWRKSVDPTRLPGALASVLADNARQAPTHADWREGHLLAMGKSPARLSEDVRWLASPSAQRAFGRLFERLRRIEERATVKTSIERVVEGVTVSYTRFPSAGAFDARYEGSAARSVSAWAMSAAALLNRAARHAPEEAIAQGPMWEAVRLGHLRRHPLLLSLEREPPAKPVYFGRARSPEAPYVMAHSLEEIERLERPERPKPSAPPAAKSSRAPGGSS